MTRDVPRAVAPGRDDRGSAAVLVLTAAAVVVLAAVLLSALGAVAVARHRAAAAADLAALAAATRLHEGEAAACERARAVAAAAGAVLLDCRREGLEVAVTAQVRPPGRVGELGAAVSRARAGPRR